MAFDINRRSLRVARSAIVLAAAGLAAVLGSVAPAQADDATTTIPVHASQVPTTAGDFDTNSCDNIPGGASTTKDGWVFVLPGNHGVFTSLSLTFTDTDGRTVQLGIPTDGGAILTNGASKAWIQTPADWTLTDAHATVTGDEDYFNITHTCPATSSPTASPSQSSTTSPSSSPSVTPSESASSPSTGPTATSPTSAAPSESCSVSPAPSASPMESPAPCTNGAGPTTAAPATSPASSGGSLPVTGVALGGIVAAAVALLSAGVAMTIIWRRRRVTETGNAS